MAENEEKSYTIKRLFQVMFHRKITLISITLGGLLVGLLGIKLIYNPGKQIYKAEYKYNVNSLNGNGSYIDGTKFYFNDIISGDALEEIKGSNKDYGNIDVEGMLESDAISLQYVTEYNENKEVEQQYYQFIVKQSYFNSFKQAKAFINEVVNYPIEKNKKLQININYKSNLDKYDSVEFYSSQIGYLSDQYSYLSGHYDSLIANYGDIMLKDGKKISQYKSELDMYYTNARLSDLSYELSLKGYVKDYDNRVNNLKLEKENLKKQYDLNSTIIAELKQTINDLLSSGATSQNLDLSSYNAKITELIVANANIQQSMDDLDKQINHGNTTPLEFTAKLAKFRQDSESQTDTYIAIEKEVVGENSSVFTINTNVISAEGGISTIMGAGLSFVLGLVIACITNLIIDSKYLYEDFPIVEKKKEEK